MPGVVCAYYLVIEPGLYPDLCSLCYGSLEHPIQFPFVNYSESVTAFVKAVYRFVDTHPAMDIRNYSAILEEAGLKWDYTVMSNADVTGLTGRTLMALILGAIRADRFCEGTLLSFFNEGHIIKWLQRLKQIDLGTEGDML